MKNLLFISLLVSFICCGKNALFAQDIEFELEISNDSILLGNLLEVKYTIRNAQGDFSPPDFDGMVLVGGPNISSQFSMINGKVTQSVSYGYILQPISQGEYFIDGASLNLDGEKRMSPSFRIVALANPGGYTQQRRGKSIKLTDVYPDSLNKYQKIDSSRIALPKLKTKKI